MVARDYLEKEPVFHKMLVHLFGVISSPSCTSYCLRRVAVINEHTDIESWRYEPTKENPADFATRGVTADHLSATHPWLIEPSFL